MITRLLIAVALAVPLLSCASPAEAVSTYDTVVLADGPVLFHAGDNGADATGNGHAGTLYNTPGTTTMPNGDSVLDFDGATEYVQVPDHDALSVPTTGILTVEAWIRPDVLEFPNDESSGYVHWLGKCASGGNAEWTMRMYSYTNTENRPNRISGYGFNLTGGLGTGGYFQDPVTAGEWIHVVFTINKNAVSGTYPNGYGKIWKNGTLRRTQDMNYGGTPISPGNGTAPMRYGTRDLNSYFEGAIGKVAIYDRELSTTEIQDHYNAM